MGKVFTTTNNHNKDFTITSQRDSIMIKGSTTINNHRDFTITNRKDFIMINKMRKKQQQSLKKAWKNDKYASKVMDACIDRTSKLLTAHFVANKHKPGPIENRCIAQVSAERMCYEAAEIFMNETAPNATITGNQKATL